ncbi:MAG: hypothetical protein KCHDKBKB_03017 [Elusimicrobia bacterium]|nr:hypothetical protein [Elusimicrobiota bacterium]
MARSHAEAGLVKLYMAAKGVRSLRTAQHHAKNRHPDYVAFVATQGVEALKAKEATSEQKVALSRFMQGQSAPGEEVVHLAPPAMSKPRHEWTPEEYAECEAWTGLVAANTQRDAALKRSDPMAAIGFVKIAADALKSYHLARQRRVQSELESGRLQPMSAWEEARAAIHRFAAFMITFDDRIAQRANPEKPHFARQAILDLRENEFNPALDALMAELTL